MSFVPWSPLLIVFQIRLSQENQGQVSKIRNFVKQPTNCETIFWNWFLLVKGKTATLTYIKKIFEYTRQYTG